MLISNSARLLMDLMSKTSPPFVAIPSQVAKISRFAKNNRKNLIETYLKS